MRNILIHIVFLSLSMPFFGYSCPDQNVALSPECVLEYNAGNCKAAIPKFYFDAESASCKEFIYGGCGGIVPFDTLEECQQGCILPEVKSDLSSVESRIIAMHTFSESRVE